MKINDIITAITEADQLIKQATEKFELEVGPAKQAKEELKELLKAELKERGELSVRVESGSASLSIKRTPQIADESVLVGWLKGMNLNEYIQERVSDLGKNAVLETAKTEEVPGIEIKETEYLRITPKKEKE